MSWHAATQLFNLFVYSIPKFSNLLIAKSSNLIIFAFMLEKLKSKLIERKLNRIQKDGERYVRACNVSSAKKIGILYEATEENQFNVVRNLLNELHNKVSYVKALGYSDTKELADFHLQPLDFSFFCRKDLNWYGLPSEEAVADFINTDFDILICLNLIDKNPLTYIMSESKAGFKVGLFSDLNSRYLDMMVNLDEESFSESELAKQIIYYLENISYEQ